MSVISVYWERTGTCWKDTFMLLKGMQNDMCERASSSSVTPQLATHLSLSFPPLPFLICIPFVLALVQFKCCLSLCPPSLSHFLFSLSFSPAFPPATHPLPSTPNPHPASLLTSSLYPPCPRHSLFYPSLFSYYPPSFVLSLSLSLTHTHTLSHSQTGFWKFIFLSTIHCRLDWSLPPLPSPWEWALQIAHLCPSSTASLHSSNSFSLRVSVFPLISHINWLFDHKLLVVKCAKMKWFLMYRNF